MENPLVSFCLITYNQERFILDALQGAVSQDYDNIEIIVSDDCSTDNTSTLIDGFFENYKGDKKIILNRNGKNIGIREHCNKVLGELSHGEIIVLAAGDDVSLPNRVSRCVELLVNHPTVMSMSVRSQKMNENGINYPEQLFDRISRNNYSLYTLADYISMDNLMCLSGDSRVIRRKVIEAFPPLRYSYAEDVFLFVRSFYLGDVIYLREPLVRYRQHDGSVMGKSRLKKTSSKSDIEKWERTSIRQLRVDYQYAVDNGYINPSEAYCMQEKLDKLIAWLKPKRKTVWWRIVHRLSKKSARCFNKWLKALE